MDVAAVFAGVPSNYVVMAFAGGGGFLAAVGWFALRRRQEAQRATVTS